MTATNHGLMGAVIAIALQRYPPVAIAVAPFSHFLLDALPHYADDKLGLRSRKFLKILLTDMTLAVVCTLYIAWLWPHIALLVVVCAFLAASPDLMWLWLEYLRPTPQSKWPWYAKFHSLIQWSQTRRGAIVEVFWFGAVFGMIVLVGVR